MPTILEEILAHKRQVVAARKRSLPLEALWQQDEAAPTPPSFFDALVQGEDIAIVAEIKKASPSKGVIRPDFDPVAIAGIYEDNGAAALSVLTDERYFQGCDAYLTQASNVVDLPILRKDFIVDPYQVYEARAIGAAAVLLIAAALAPDDLKALLGLCEEIEIDALVEVHTREEARLAVDLGAEIVGINNRDLQTFETDLNTTLRIVDQLPEELVVVSESGIHTRDDVVRMRGAGVDAVLVGESLMREPDIGRKLRHLLGKDA